jgi:hypothetical protein
MSGERDASVQPGGFLGRQHHKLRFDDLGETFFARLILSKCADPASTEVSKVELSLSDLFRRLSPADLAAALDGKTFTSSQRFTEIGADLLSALSRITLTPGGKTSPALDFYQKHIASRLKWLKSGDSRDNRLPCIEDFTPRANGKLITFEILVRPGTLRDRLCEYIPGELELTAKLITKALNAQQRPADPGPRIDYRKQVQLLTDDLDQRQQLTGETEFAIFSNEFPFRWALQEFGGFTMPGIGTTTAKDKALLPLFLELNGYLDIVALDFESDPLQPNDILVRYSLVRPARRNIFGANNQGLDAATRSLMSETELCLYDRLHREVREGLVFGGRPRLEMSFGTITSWLIRKAAYCLQEPTFMAEPAREWLERHKNDGRMQREDEFFLPAIYEKMRSDFGSRVVKKPERFGGEIDILFDDDIPIELKVRRGQREPIDMADIDAKYRPGGQAAAYAAVSRLGFVLVLDLPGSNCVVVSLKTALLLSNGDFPNHLSIRLVSP